jgi:hypothetical protein
MANRLVRARPVEGRLPELRDRLDSGEIVELDPFGEAMTRALDEARFDSDTGEAAWVEEDYCTPPLAMEREAVLDEYFREITIVEADVDEREGWNRLEHLPRLWEEFGAEPEG